MSAMHPPPKAAATGEAVIASAVVGPGHDGEAELIVTISHPNGARETIALDAELGFHLMNACGVSDVAGLTGQPWRRILEGL